MLLGKKALKNNQQQVYLNIQPNAVRKRKFPLQKITFSSSNPNIINVDENGNVFAISAGTATITAKAPNGVTASIELNVYSKVEDIKLDIDSLILQEGETYNLIATVYPEDASNKKIKYKTENAEIATISEEGKITAIKEGTTKIIVTPEDNNQIQKDVEIKVIKKLTEEELKFNEALKIQGNIISGFDYKNMTVDNIKKYITTKYEIQIENYKGNKIEKNQLVGTGSKIKIINDSQEIIAQYTIVLYGDINGDGKINSVDLLVLQRHILEIQTIEEIFQKAGNINKNGKKPTSVDLLLIQRHILEIQIIKQRDQGTVLKSLFFKFFICY